jgi:hypothetical protein
MQKEDDVVCKEEKCFFYKNGNPEWSHVCRHCNHNEKNVDGEKAFSYLTYEFKYGY